MEGLFGGGKNKVRVLKGGNACTGHLALSWLSPSYSWYYQRLSSFQTRSNFYYCLHIANDTLRIFVIADLVGHIYSIHHINFFTYANLYFYIKTLVVLYTYSLELHNKHCIQDETSILVSHAQPTTIQILNQRENNIICKENIRHCWVLTKKTCLSMFHLHPTATQFPQLAKKPSI